MNSRFGMARRWFRISIRTLMLLIFILCAWLAIWTARARRQEEAVRRLIDAGATVRYRHEFDAAGNPIPTPVVPGPQWMRKIFGNHAFWRVYSVAPGSAIGLRDEDLQPLAQLSTIEQLRLGDKTIDEGLSNVAELSNLKSLQIDSSHVTDRGLKQLGNLKNLESLSLQYAQVDDEGLRQLAPLAHLNFISLRHTMVTGDGVAWLKQQLPKAYIDAACPSRDEEKQIASKLFKLGARLDAGTDGWISGVELIGHEITDEAIDLADSLQHLGGVRIRNARISPAAIIRLREHHPNIVIDPKFPAKVMDDVDAISAIQQLDSRISFDGNGYVQRVDIDGQQLGENDLAPLEKLSHLKQLFIYSAAVDDTGLQYVAHLSNLTILIIGSYHGTDAGLEHLAGLANLQTLTLQGGAITDLSLTQLAKLKSLKNLVLVDSQVEGPGLSRLNRLAALAGLSLTGRKSAIRDDGLQYLSDLPALKRLNLYSAPISDGGLVHLETLTSLELLSLMNTAVTDAGLERLRKLTNLKTLNLQNTEVTKEGVEQFLKHVPECKVND
jgi:Leucine-rich repeat (LRR) protein